MDGVNPNTVWTWNAIGKRNGAWNLAADSPEFTQGVSAEPPDHRTLAGRDGAPRSTPTRSPGRPPGTICGCGSRRRRRRSRLQRARLRDLGHPPSLAPPPDIVRYGAPAAETSAATARRPNDRSAGAAFRARKSSASSSISISASAAMPARPRARNGTPAGTWRRCPISTPMATAPGASGSTASIRSRKAEGEGARTVHFPKSCLHCEDAACVTVCPTGASYKRAEDGIVLVNESICIGCKLCSWACPYGAREFDADEGVMKKCTLCIDRIYNENLAAEERQPACVMVCPTKARFFGDLGDPNSAVSELVAARGGKDLMPELGYRPVNKYLPPRRDRHGAADFAAAAGRAGAGDARPAGCCAGSTGCCRGERNDASRVRRSSSSRPLRAPALRCCSCSGSACRSACCRPSRWFGFAGAAIAVVLAAGGLVSSVFHLGRPERAWRAFSQWRSSWLSREGVLSVADLCPGGDLRDRLGLLRRDRRAFRAVRRSSPRLAAGDDLLHRDDLRLAEADPPMAQPLDRAELFRARR